MLFSYCQRITVTRVLCINSWQFIILIHPKHTDTNTKKHSCIFNSITVDYNTIINGLSKITVQTKVRETKSWRLLNTPFTQYIFSLIGTSYTLALFYHHYIKMDINTTSFSKFTIFSIKKKYGYVIASK